jgi:hypothetical protein
LTSADILLTEPNACAVRGRLAIINGDRFANGSGIDLETPRAPIRAGRRGPEGGRQYRQPGAVPEPLSQASRRSNSADDRAKA